MFPPSSKKNGGGIRGKTYPYSGIGGSLKEGAAMAMLALSHTSVEHELYETMRREVAAANPVGVFSVRSLLALTSLGSFSTVRRGLVGLINKQSIELEKLAVMSFRGRYEGTYRVFGPEEIFLRRRAAGLAPYPREIEHCGDNLALSRAVRSVVIGNNLSRREIEVALCCAEGLSNAEIGERLFISEQTVKFHLRHIFIKLRVRRRGELISRLLTPEV